MTHLDLASPDKQQLTALLWELKGTPAVHAIHQELRARSAEVTVKFSDPDWENKTDEALKRALGIVSKETSVGSPNQVIQRARVLSSPVFLHVFACIPDG